MLSVTTSFASENAFQEVFMDAFYGGAAGALVGSAFMAFTKKPADHLEDLGFGAGIGILAGATYGIAKTTRSLAEIDNGRVRIAMPTIIPDLVESPVTKQTSITWRAEILRGTFH
jgi:hypothetical protein